jgi:hypothetical protein
MYPRIFLIAAALSFLLMPISYGETPDAISGKKATTLLRELGTALNIEITSDESVTCSAPVSDIEFSSLVSALEEAKKTNGLIDVLTKFFTEKGIRIYISADQSGYSATMVKIEYSSSTGICTIDAENVEALYIVHAVLKAMDVRFLDDNSFPVTPISIHEKSLFLPELIAKIEKTLGITDETFTRFKQVVAERVSGLNIAHVSYTDTEVVLNNMELGEFIWRAEDELGVRIIRDPTIDPNIRVACKFEPGKLDQVIDSLLAENHIFINKSESVWYLSTISFNEEADKDSSEEEIGIPTAIEYSISSSNTLAVSILDKISQETWSIILYDPLPEQKISINLEHKTLLEILKSIAGKLQGFEVETIGSGFYIWNTSRMDSVSQK